MVTAFPPVFQCFHMPHASLLASERYRPLLDGATLKGAAARHIRFPYVRAVDVFEQRNELCVVGGGVWLTLI